MEQQEDRRRGRVTVGRGSAGCRGHQGCGGAGGGMQKQPNISSEIYASLVDIINCDPSMTVVIFELLLSSSADYFVLQK